MFNSATFLRLNSSFQLPPMAQLEEILQKAKFTHCGATQEESFGWIPPRGNKSTLLAEPVGAGVILRLCIERRAVPPSAIKDEVDAMVEKYKEQTGADRVSGKVKKDFKEEAIQTLLPRAFTKRSSMTIWIDPASKFVVVDSGSLAGADKVVSQFVSALAEIPDALPSGALINPIQTRVQPSAAMAHWLQTQEAPVAFTVDRDCELKMPDDLKSTVRYSRHTLEINEVADHIIAGKLPTMLTMTWNDRVSFVLTDASTLKKIDLLDVVLDGQGASGKDDDGFDTDAAIITGELTAMLPALIAALGGEEVSTQSELI